MQLFIAIGVYMLFLLNRINSLNFKLAQRVILKVYTQLHISQVIIFLSKTVYKYKTKMILFYHPVKLWNNKM